MDQGFGSAVGDMADSLPETLALSITLSTFFMPGICSDSDELWEDEEFTDFTGDSSAHHIYELLEVELCHQIANSVSISRGQVYYQSSLAS